jgi:hypothetical protein
MVKWVVIVCVVVIVLGLFRPTLARWWSLGRLPGDLQVRFRGQTYFFPFTSTLLISFFAWWVWRML